MKFLFIVVATALSVSILTMSFINKQPALASTTRIDSLISYLKKPTDKHILVAAHRADWRNFPENSLEGVISCVNMGVDIVEIDVQKTKDGQLVIMHDKTVDRMTNGTGKIADLTLEDIKKLNLKNAYGYVTNYKVPLLEDVLLAVKGKAFLFIDKAYKHIPEANKIVEKTGTEKEALFEGTATLQELKTDYPDQVGKIQYMPRLNGDKKNIETLNYLNDYANAKSLVATFILSYTKENAPGIYYSTEIRKKNISVMANALWPETSAEHDDDASVINPDNGWGWLIKHGANIICTDRPQMLLNYLHLHQQHN
jgi:glycerophosphoryl diester phosphodiesterase